MAATGSFEAYMDANPMQSWDRNVWDEYDISINTGFHSPAVFFSPLMNYVAMPAGADTYYTGNEILRGHTNHNDIGLRARFIDAMYVDMRRKKLVSAERHGGKAQVHEFDEINNRFDSGSRRWFLEVLRTRLMGGIVETHEKLARNALYDYALHQYLANGDKLVDGTSDFSDMDTSASYKIDIQMLSDVRLRLAERSMDVVQEWGDYASPIPGQGSDLLVLTTPNVMYDLWNTEEGRFMRDLREMQDERVINGGVARWRGITFAETMWARLWNVGEITTQCAITSAVNFGDGAVDPDHATANQVDSIYLVGQSGTDQTHYVQLSDFAAGEYVVGNRVTLHVERTDAYGITDGVDFTDGMTMEAEIYTVDATLNRLTFRQPLPIEFRQAFTYTTLASVASTGTAYGFVTKAQDIHPIIVVGSRGMATYAARTKVRINTDLPDPADLPGIKRITWDEYGEMNPWNSDFYEIIYCAASTGGGGGRAKVAVG